MKTNQRLLARATTTACLIATLFAPTTNAQYSASDIGPSAFEDAVQTLSHTVPLDVLAANSVTADIADQAMIDRAEAPIMSSLDWHNYGERLTEALSGEHAGLRHSALRLIIAYADDLEMGNETVVDLMKVYRNDNSEQARRMAVVAMAEIDSKLAVDYLERSHEFEKSPAVKRTIAAVVAAHRAS